MDWVASATARNASAMTPSCSSAAPEMAESMNARRICGFPRSRPIAANRHTASSNARDACGRRYVVRMPHAGDGDGDGDGDGAVSFASPFGWSTHTIFKPLEPINLERELIPGLQPRLRLRHTQDDA